MEIDGRFNEEQGIISFMLGVAHRIAMEEQGFCVVEDVFSREEMGRLASSIERYQSKHQAALRAKGGEDGISRAEEITFTDHIAEQDEEIMSFCKRPELVALATEFLGPNVDLYWNQSVYKMPEGEKQFPWHQDDGYTPVDPSPYLTVWLALTDATPENGCISALPGSHKKGLLRHEQTPLGLSCHSTEDADQGVLVPVRAGSMAVFWSLTAHKSGSNRSSETRKAYIIQYAKAGLRRRSDGALIPDLEPIVRG